jgi:hypothetical protein
MINNDSAHRPTSNQQSNLPVLLNRVRTHYHYSRHDSAERKRPFELLADMAHSLEESNVFDFFGCASPLHIDAEEMRKEGLADVQRNTTEEDCKHGYPFEVLAKCLENVAIFDTVAQDAEGYITDEREDEDDGDVNFEAVDVVVIEPAVEEADQKVVEYGEDPGRSDGVVGTDVGHDGDFGGKRHVGGEESHEETGERTALEPVLEWVKD